MEQSKNILMQFHPMRLALYLCVVASILLRPSIGSELIFEGWTIVSSLLVPVLVPIFFMLLMLDALMSRVWLSDAIESKAIEAEVGRLKLINRTDLFLGIILLGFWVPFYVSLS
jgi:hypothetical protein